MTHITANAYQASSGFGARAAALSGTILRHTVETLIGWQERAGERRHLRELDDRMLKDIGISRVDALREADKPFWRK